MNHYIGRTLTVRVGEEGEEELAGAAVWLVKGALQEIYGSCTRVLQEFHRSSTRGLQEAYRSSRGAPQELLEDLDRSSRGAPQEFYKSTKGVLLDLRSPGG